MAGRCRAQKTVEKGVGGGDKQCIHRRRHVRYHSGSPFTKGKHLAGRAWCDHGIDSQIYLIGYHGSAPSGSFHGGFPDVVFAYRRATLSRVDLAGQPPVGSTRDPLAGRRLTFDGYAGARVEWTSVMALSSAPIPSRYMEAGFFVQNVRSFVDFASDNTSILSLDRDIGRL